MIRERRLRFAATQVRGRVFRYLPILLVALVAAGPATSRSAHAYTFKQLAQMCRGNTCGGGDYPDGSIVRDALGNLYGGGTTELFKLSPEKGKALWSDVTIYKMGDPGLVDGSTVFGATGTGGSHGLGYIFKLTPNAAKTKWTPDTLYNFCASPSCTDGRTPNPGLVMDGPGRIYGTTERGGEFCVKQVGCGTAYMLTLNKDGKWTHTVIHSFYDPSVKDDGADPTANVIVGADGRLYGTTSTGGANKKGTVFELKPNADKTKFTATVLYSFCAKAMCVDGDTPYGGVAMDKSGRLYGTTNVGGRNDGGDTGTVFMLTPDNAAKTKWTETVIHKFCASGACASDGTEPSSGVIVDADDNLYGMTPEGGSMGAGVAYELTPNATKTKWKETILHNFCLQAGCPDGAQPQGALVRDKDGNLFGTTESGGNFSNGGTAFELVK
jgi:uncharacterized repeat protein (TIGR03803 family)